MSWVSIGAGLGFLSVALGAFGAHALKQSLSEYQLGIWKTSTEYLFYHAFALILFGFFQRVWGTETSEMPGFLFLAGSFLFSGSLYALALSDIKILGAITPLGGLSFMAGWIWFAILAYKK